MQRFQKAKCFLAVFLLVISLFVGILPAHASLAAVVADGTFGEEDNLTWVLENTGLLVISGKGKMQDKYVQDYPWYAYADQITAVKIHDGVQNVGTYIFEEYDRLETVEIGEGILAIGKYSFNFCNNLRSVRIPESLRRIDEQAFFMCPLLTDVQISDASLWCGIEFMSDHANPLCNGADLLADGEIVTEVTVPDFVTTLGNFQFYGCQSIERINLHGKVDAIGADAFAKCPSLRFVSCAGTEEQLQKITEGNPRLSKDLFVLLADGKNKLVDGNLISEDGTLIKIGSSASVVRIPDDTKTVAVNAGAGLENLSALILPASVEKIAENAFSDCPKLTEVYFAGTEEQWLAVSGDGIDNANVHFESEWIEQDGVVYNEDQTVLIGATDAVAQEIVVPDSVTLIADGAFRNCFSLRQITLPAGIVGLPDALFENCRNLQAVTLSDKLCAIGNRAFGSCIRLSDIALPETVSQVGQYAFFSCRALRSAVLPSAVTVLANGVFADCSRLEKIRLSEELSKIGDNAFLDCYNLKEITLPKTVTSLGISAFNGCASLTDIFLPDSIATLPDQVFYGCYNLQKVVFPSAMTEIGRYAFYDCIALCALNLPDTLIKIGEYAFFGCESLTEVVLPPAVERLEVGVFMACLRLTRLTLPAKTQDIRKQAFGYCQNMTDLFIPASATSIDADAFYRCTALKNIYFGGTNEQWIDIYPGVLNNITVFFDHTHTPGRWYVIDYPQAEKEGIAANNCTLCHAVSTDRIPATDFFCDEKATLDMDGRIVAAPGLSAADILQRAGEGAVITKADGEIAEAQTLIGTGMTLLLADGTQYEILVVGDTTGDGQIMADDARFVLRFSVGLETAEADSALYRACDVDDIFGVSSSDARSILRVAVGLEQADGWKR